MSIFVPDIPTFYGSLDSDAVQEDLPFSAHVAKEMARSANRLTSKGQQLVCLVWPTRDDPDAANDTPSDVLKKPFGDTVPRSWRRIIGPLPVTKKSGLTRADVRIAAMITGTDTIDVQIATLAAPYSENPSAYNRATLTGDGDTDFDGYSIDDILISEGSSEVFEVYVRASSDRTLGDTAEFGTPNTGNILSAATDSIGVDGAAWNTTQGGRPSDWASAGHTIVLFDEYDNEVAARSIVDVGPVQNLGSGDFQRLTFAPSIAPSRLPVLAGGTFEIRKDPDLAISCLAIAATERV